MTRSVRLFAYWTSGLFAYLLIPIPVAAQCNADAPGFACLEGIFSNIVKSVISLSVVALFIMLIVGGFKLIFSGGDAKQTEAAKGTITAAILGTVVIAVSYLILQLIGKITGVQSITTFTIPTN